jgi:hypothetical protein
MVEREWQIPQSVCKRPRTNSIFTPCAALKESYRFFRGQDGQRHFIRQSRPVRKARRDQDPRAARWQKSGNLIWARNVVVNQQPSSALSGEVVER